jgi:hypothetical protein
VIERVARILRESGRAVAEGFIATERRARKQRVRHLHGYS